MKRNYRLNGLDCAHCASKLETALSKIKGVKSVSISFMTLKMIIEVVDESVFEEVFKMIKKMEPEVEPKRC